VQSGAFDLHGDLRILRLFRECDVADGYRLAGD
jgi:hypothetical protein